MLNVRHLAVFRAVVRTGSVTTAARMLHVSQPAVTKTLRLLEERMGLPLFLRIKGRLVCTPEAETLMPEVERLFGNVEAVAHLADEIREGYAGSITIATVATLSASLVSTSMTRFHAKYPSVRFDMKALATRHVLDYVNSGQVDIGVLDLLTGGGDVETHELCRAEIACIMRDDHALARRRTLGPRDLADETLVGFADDTMTGWRVREAFRASGTPCHITFTANHTMSAYALVQSGTAIALVDPFPMISGAYAGLIMRPFRPAIEMKPTAVFSRTRPVSQIARKFLTEMTSVAGEMIAASSLLKRP